MIHDYYYKPSPIFYKEEGEGWGERFYGIELEVDSGLDEDGFPIFDKERLGEDSHNLVVEYLGSSVYIKADSSLEAGFEIVSHPRTLRSWVVAGQMWSSALDYLGAEGYMSHNAGTCGLHVHVGKNKVGGVALAKIGTLFARNRHWLRKISRRSESQFDRWCQDDTGPDLLRKCAKKVGGKRGSLNLNPGPTVEFRLFRGSLRWDRILGSIQIIDSLLDWADQVSMSTVSVKGYVGYVLQDRHCKKWNFAQEILEGSLCA